MRLIQQANGSGRRGVLTVVAAVLAVLGAGIISVGVLSQQSAAGPSPSAAGTVAESRVPTDRTGPTEQPSPASTPPPSAIATPVSIGIPAIAVHSSLVRLGQNPDGTVQVPDSYQTAGWYAGSVRPGQLGPSVILGHIDSKAGPGVFFRLGDLRPGDTVAVRRSDGSSVTFRITGVRQYPKDNFPTIAVYGDTSTPAIRLITCGGSFDHATGHYRSNIVAFGVLDAS